MRALYLVFHIPPPKDPIFFSALGSALQHNTYIFLYEVVHILKPIRTFIWKLVFMKLVCVISSSSLDLFILVELSLQCRGGGICPGKISRASVGWRGFILEEGLPHIQTVRGGGFPFPGLEGIGLGWSLM